MRDLNFIKNLFTTDNVIFYNQYFINGNIFYGVEYLEYLKDLNFKLIFNIPTKSFAIRIYKLWQDKYIIDKVNALLPNIYFSINKKIITNNLIFLDGTSINSLDKNIFAKNILYNFGDNKNSLNHFFKKQKNKKIITFGDRELGSLIDYHYPLKLNYNLFKNLKIQKGIFIEDKRDKLDTDIYSRKRNIKNFHSTFNHLIFYKENFWERANRLIPECKFYNKNIEFYNFDPWIDSTDLRYWRSYEYYDINKSNFKKFVFEFTQNNL